MTEKHTLLADKILQDGSNYLTVAQADIALDHYRRLPSLLVQALAAAREATRVAELLNPDTQRAITDEVKALSAIANGTDMTINGLRDAAEAFERALDRTRNMLGFDVTRSELAGRDRARNAAREACHYAGVVRDHLVAEAAIAFARQGIGSSREKMKSRLYSQASEPTGCKDTELVG